MRDFYTIAKKLRDIPYATKRDLDIDLSFNGRQHVDLVLKEGDEPIAYTNNVIMIIREGLTPDYIENELKNPNLYRLSTKEHESLYSDFLFAKRGWYSIAKKAFNDKGQAVLLGKGLYKLLMAYPVHKKGEKNRIVGVFRPDKLIVYMQYDKDSWPILTIEDEEYYQPVGLDSMFSLDIRYLYALKPMDLFFTQDVTVATGFYTDCLDGYTAFIANIVPDVIEEEFVYPAKFQETRT